jgi:hypothetical protein
MNIILYKKLKIKSKIKAHNYQFKNKKKKIIPQNYSELGKILDNWNNKQSTSWTDLKKLKFQEHEEKKI